MDRSVELTARARDAADAAATAAEHMRIRYNPSTVANRIRAISAELRGIGRRRDAAAERERLIEYGVPATDIGLGGLSAAGAAALEEQHRYLTAQLEHWSTVRAEQIRDGVATNYCRADLRPGDLVLHRGRWYPVVRVNAKSVTVPSLLGDWTDTVRYEHITDIAGPATHDGPSSAPRPWAWPGRSVDRRNPIRRGWRSRNNSPSNPTGGGAS